MHRGGAGSLDLATATPRSAEFPWLLRPAGYIGAIPDVSGETHAVLDPTLEDHWLNKRCIYSMVGISRSHPKFCGAVIGLAEGDSTTLDGLIGQPIRAAYQPHLVDTNANIAAGAQLAQGLAADVHRAAIRMPLEKLRATLLTAKQMLISQKFVSEE
eukprot:2802259-Amphidinium_carterae.1